MEILSRIEIAPHSSDFMLSFNWRGNRVDLRGEEGDGEELGRLITRVMKDNNRAARIHTSLNQKHFSGSKLLHLAIFTMNLLLQCRRSSCQSRECLVVHGNNRFAMEQELSMRSK